MKTSAMRRTGSPGAADYRVEVDLGRTRLAGLSVLGLGFVLVGVWMVASAAAEGTSPAVGVAGAIGVLFFGTCLIWGLLRLTQRAPALVLDNTGLHDQASAIPAGTIPWSNIAAAQAMRFGTQSMLAVGCHDPQAVVDNATGLRRLLLATNAKMMATPVNIPGILLPVKLSTVESEINAVLTQRWQEHYRTTGHLQQP